MEQGKYEQRERLIREYFRCWLENRPEKLGDIFAPGISKYETSVRCGASNRYWAIVTTEYRSSRRIDGSIKLNNIILVGMSNGSNQFIIV